MKTLNSIIAAAYEDEAAATRYSGIAGDVTDITVRVEDLMTGETVTLASDNPALRRERNPVWSVVHYLRAARCDVDLRAEQQIDSMSHVKLVTTTPDGSPANRTGYYRVRGEYNRK